MSEIKKAIRENNIEFVRNFLNENPNDEDLDYFLEYATRRRNIEAVKLFLKCNFKIRRECFETSIVNGDMEIFELLLEKINGKLDILDILFFMRICESNEKLEILNLILDKYKKEIDDYNATKRPKFVYEYTDIICS